MFGLNLSITSQPPHPPIDIGNPENLTDWWISQSLTPVSDEYRAIVQAAYEEYIDEGLFAKFDGIFTSYTETEQQSLINWCPKGRTAVKFGGGVWSKAGGWDPDGVDDYIQPNSRLGLPGENFQQNSAYMAAWFLGGDVLAGPADSNDVGTANAKITRRSTGTQDNVRAVMASNASITSPATGDKAWSRDGANSWRYFVDGAIVGADPRTDASTPTFSSAAYIGRLTSSAYGTNPVSVFRWDSHLTSAQAAVEHGIWATFKAAFEALE